MVDQDNGRWLLCCTPALRAKHRNLCRGVPPLAACWLCPSHRHAGTACDIHRPAMHASPPTKDMENPAARGHENGALRLHGKETAMGPETLRLRPACLEARLFPWRAKPVSVLGHGPFRVRRGKKRQARGARTACGGNSFTATMPAVTPHVVRRHFAEVGFRGPRKRL